MINIFYIFMFGLFLTMIFSVKADAETFEFLNYTLPNGWKKQESFDKTTFQRTNGIGAIVFYASYPTNNSPDAEFAKMWREWLESQLAVKPPTPQIEREGNMTAAVGAATVNAQGTMTTAVLTAFVGRGRAICVLSLSAGDDVLREVMAFFDSIKILPETAVPQMNSKNSTSEIEVDFQVPSGYTAKREGQSIVFTPAQLNDKTPCVYGISPARTSKGNLETDARAAILEMLPGWRIKSDYYNAIRGISADGWEFYRFMTDVQSLAPIDGSVQYLTAITMAFPASSGKTNIVWGFGKTGLCQLDDLAFAQLFHSLRPHGIASDGGKALMREMIGTWRDVQERGVAQYRFFADGRYEYGIGTITQFGTLQTTTSSVKNGRYKLSNGELILTSESGEISKLLVRIYDHYNRGGWRRAMSVLKESGGNVLDIRYFRVED